MTDISLKERAEKVKTQEDFESFTESLARDFQDKENEWENNNLASFLNGITGFVQDLNGYSRHSKEPPPPATGDWATFAIILAAATIYE
jgi:hypothetical protein